MKKLIEYKGQKVETTLHKPMSDELFNELNQQYYAKPTFKNIVDDFILLLNGGVMNTNITNYYFKDLMSKTVLHDCKWSISDVFEHKPLLERFYALIFKNDKVYDSETTIDNIETALRIGGIGVARKPSNYPLSSIYEILSRYNINNNWYDMSCGWGARLTGALVKGVNYYGTDPNYLLVDRLYQLNKDWKQTTKTKSFVDIRATGSEIFHEDWVNKIGLCFTSPPYFNLEDYKVGEQSYQDGVSYESWLHNYLIPTILNCHKYLIDEGILAININNFASGGVEYKLFDDTMKIALENGFAHIENITLQNIQRINSKGELNDNSEKIMVFMKKGFEHLFVNRVAEQLDIFDFMGDD